jgi:ligand-binding sensor domain-containing protein
MAVRSASDVWLSHQSSSTIARFHDGEWSFVEIDELETLADVWIVADGVGSVYAIGTHSGRILSHDGSQWGNYGSVPSGWETSIPVGDVERGLWLASEAGIVRSANQDWEVVVEADQYPDGSLSAFRLTPGGDPVVATYTEESTVQVGVWTGSEFDTTDILPHLEYPYPVIHLAFGPDGEIWAATPVEIVQLTSGDVARLPPGGWDGTRIYDSAVDHDGALWITHSDGVDRYADGEWWGSYGDDGVDISWATGVDVAHDGTVWVSSHGAYSFDGTGWSKFTTADGVISRTLMGVTVAGDGCVWFISDRSGLARFCPA